MDMPSSDEFEAPQGTTFDPIMLRAISEALAGNGIVSSGDFEVTTTATDLEVSVADGTSYYEASETSLNNPPQALAVAAGGSTGDRWDTIYFDADTGDAGVREGTEGDPANGVYPSAPDIQGDEILLAVAYVEQGATDVSDDDIHNWRAQFPNEAESVHYDDTSGIYGVDSVAGALDALTEASQIESYPLSSPDLATGSVTSDEIEDLAIATGDIADSAITSAKIEDPTIISADIESGAVTDDELGAMGAAIEASDNPQSFGPFLDAPVNSGSPDDTVHSYALAMGGVGVVEVRGLSDGAGGVDNLSFRFLAGPDLNGNNLSDGAITYIDTTAGHVPRAQVDDRVVRSATQTSAYATSDEETVPVDPTGTGGVTVTLSSSDAEAGNRIAVKDVGGTAEANPITVDTEGGETIDGGGYVVIDTDYESVVVESDGSGWNALKPINEPFDLRTVFEGTETGEVADGDQGVLVVDSLDDGETVEVHKAALTTATVEAVPSGVTLDLVTFDNSGSFAVRQELASGDGSAVHDRVTGDPLADYTNNSGSPASVGVIVDNGSGSPQEVVAKIEGTVPG